MELKDKKIKGSVDEFQKLREIEIPKRGTRQNKEKTLNTYFKIIFHNIGIKEKAKWLASKMGDKK